MTVSELSLDGRLVGLRPATAGDLRKVETLLTALSLPTAGTQEWWPHFTLAEADGALVGLAGIERYADGILVRSVAVHPDWRGSGLGRALVESVLGEASRAGARDAYLLTTTAERYFPRLGFRVITREAVPVSVQQSVEFREACPATAIVMHRSLSS
ncbi:MAG TPA: arsenic resistance N-acetyltransferase ArsN2 [Gemmatimonadales bacterium]|nr:arsenic resistance N-acetyltransferase ArsN2 [Gemmatimonadales bacterium]